MTAGVSSSFLTHGEKPMFTLHEIKSSVMKAARLFEKAFYFRERARTAHDDRRFLKTVWYGAVYRHFLRVSYGQIEQKISRHAYAYNHYRSIPQSDWLFIYKMARLMGDRYVIDTARGALR